MYIMVKQVTVGIIRSILIKLYTRIQNLKKRILYNVVRKIQQTYAVPYLLDTRLPVYTIYITFVCKTALSLFLIFRSMFVGS